MKSRNFYRHKMEIPIFVISIIVSLLIFVILSYLGFEATLGSEKNNIVLQVLEIETSSAETVMKIGGYLSIAILIYMIFKIVISYYGFAIDAKAKDVYITQNQLSVLIEAEEEYAKKLEIKEMPQLFVANEKKTIDIEGVNVINNPHIIRIPCDKIIVSADKGYYGAKFTIAKHLAYIYMGYYEPIFFILMTFVYLVPILNNLKNRVMQYTSDKIAAELLGKEQTINAIMEETVSIWFIPYIDTKEYIENIKNVVKDKDVIFANIFNDEPISAYRIDALRENKDGKLL